MTFEPCSNCLIPQPITAMNCGACGHLLIEPEGGRFSRALKWSRKHWRELGVLAGFLLYINAELPAPIAPSYWIKRVIWTPTYICSDGIYSWARKGSSGVCSSHGGVRQSFQ